MKYGLPGADEVIVKLTKAESFYAKTLARLKKTRIPFLVGGTYAVNAYTGLDRATKDLDVFCRGGEMPGLLDKCRLYGAQVELTDERWLAKLWDGKSYVDVIFGSSNASMHITDVWFQDGVTRKILGEEVQLISPTELIWSKAFILDRYKYDGSDIVHIILRQHDKIDWHRLLVHFDQFWELFLMHVLNFRFIYPSERSLIPAWLLTELLSRLDKQRALPKTDRKICRGRLFSRSEYQADVKAWGFTDLIG